MAIPKTSRLIKPNNNKSRSPIFLLTASISIIAILYLISSLISTTNTSRSTTTTPQSTRFHIYHHHRSDSEKFLYWGNRIDCPGKHCDSCQGLGHQESSLRCALEEAIVLHRYFLALFLTVILLVFFLLILWLISLLFILTTKSYSLP